MQSYAIMRINTAPIISQGCTNNHVFTENSNKYCCIGAQPGRAERGVQSGLYRLKYGFPSKEWDSIHRVAFDRYMDTDIIRHISCARSRVKFKTMEPSPSSTHKKLARYYNGLGFGIIVFLRSHINRDFTMSIVQAHIHNHNYQVDDRILCYFTFPRIGTAVALWPGDFLLFTPQELHSIPTTATSSQRAPRELPESSQRALRELLVCEQTIPVWNFLSMCSVSVI
jgi:hypothetical protein